MSGFSPMTSTAIAAGPLANSKTNSVIPIMAPFPENQSAACQVDYSGPLPTSTDQHFAVITIDKI